MTKLRVYEYAKQLNMSSKEIITILNRLDVPVANHMSVMDDGMVQKVEQFFSDVKQRAAQRHATEVERELREKQRQRERAARQLEQQRQAEARSESTRSFSARTDMGTMGNRTPSRDQAGVRSGDGRSRSVQSGDVKSAAAQGSRVVDTPTARAADTGAGTETEPKVDVTAASKVESTTSAVPNHSAQRPEAETKASRDADVTASQPVASEARADRQVEARPQHNGTTENRGGSAQREVRSTSSDSRDRSSTGGYAGNRDGRPSGGGYSGNRDGSRPSGGGYSGNRDGSRPSGGGYGGNRDGSRPSGGGYSGNRDGSRPSGGGYSGNRDGNRPSGGGYGGNRDGNRPSGGGYSGNRDGNRPSGGGFGGNRDGNRPSGGGFGGNRDGRPAGGGYGGNRDGNRPSGGGGFGGNRDGGRSSGGGFGGNRDGGRPSGGGFGGNRQGGGGRPAAGRSNAAMMTVASKPASPMARKDKEKDKARDAFDHNRKEEFNEDKLIRTGGGRRRPGGPTRDAKRPELPTKATVEGSMTVGDFAKLIRREPSELIKKLLFLGIMATINQEIETDAMELIAGEFGVELTVVEPVDEEAQDMLIVEESQEDLVARPPVVTIMGHVDHGKTTLLDAIRESKVTATESGGITQHIGAYQVEINERRITFLDTPGHEAFTTMRARGAQVTDITVLVVAADDGVMPQTVEAINHAKAANVPIIVAVNKIDKPDANPDRVKQELAVHGLVPEEWGGDTIFVNVSALKHENLDGLLEMIVLVADVADLKANPTGRPRGTVIEAKLDKGRGPVATVLVQNGTLRVGDIVVAGTSYGRVRAMINDRSKRMKDAGPSTPIEIQGLGDVPSAGDLFVVYDDERAARNLVQKRLNKEKVEQQQTTSRVTLDDLYKQIQEGNMKDLHVIVKADVQGSVEALVQSIEKIEVEGVRVKVIHRGAGAITESDVALASASNAIIIGFHVRPDVNANRAAEAEKVDIRLYRVIYNVTEELEAAMKGMLDPEFKEVVIGHAEVRQTFRISKVGTVAGCYVTDGKISRDAEARVVRDGVVVYEGSLDTLKRFKDDAREVATGFECGITLEKFNDLKVGDVIEAFKMEAVKAQ